jgi:hypothetical protein
MNSRIWIESIDIVEREPSPGQPRGQNQPDIFDRLQTIPLIGLAVDLAVRNIFHAMQFRPKRRRHRQITREGHTGGSRPKAVHSVGCIVERAEVKVFRAGFPLHSFSLRAPQRFQVRVQIDDVAVVQAVQ